LENLTTALKQPALSLVNCEDCSDHASAANFSFIAYDQFTSRYNYLKDSSKAISRFIKHKFVYVQQQPEQEQQQLKLPYNTKGSRFRDHHSVYNEGEKP
jgi:hypothetical protein